MHVDFRKGACRYYTFQCFVSELGLAVQTIVWVELTREQRIYYRAVYENNVGTLLKGSTSSNVSSLRNVVLFASCLFNRIFDNEIVSEIFYKIII